jgi:UDP-glucose 4-epimerase
MKVLVTGGAGFIGSHLVDKLIELNYDVVVLDDLSTGKSENINTNAHSVKASINDNDILEELFSYHKFDCVFHLAAQINLRNSISYPEADANINIMGSLSIIKHCIKHSVKKIIFSSTGGAIYSSDEELPFTEDTLAKPSSPYGLSKLTIESYLQIMKNIHGLDYSVLRYSNVYGPRQNAHGEAGVISIFIDRMKQGLELKINGDGNQTRDFVYVKDVVAANVLALELSGVYNVCSNTETSINTIAWILMALINPTSSASPNIKYAPAISGEMIKCRLSYEKIKEKTNWQPLTSFDIGLIETVGLK